IATTLGALAGAALILHIRASAIAILFGAVLLYSAYTSIAEVPHTTESQGADRIASLLRLDGSYPTPNGMESYRVSGVPLGFLLMFVAGVLSGRLGIRSGAGKALAMGKAMKLAFNVSTTSSNLMNGVPTAARARVYVHSGT